MFHSIRIQGMRRTVVLGCAVLLLAIAIAPAAGDSLYTQGTKALDRREWQEASELFAEVAERGEEKVDAALYWRAYALQKLGRTDEALDALHRLESAYPDSRWLDDAGELQAELDGSDSLADDQLRMVALTALLESSPDRALPWLEKLLSGDAPLAVKRNALFLAIQSGNPEAMEIAVATAKRNDSPELQAAAVRGLGIAGAARSRELLMEVYDSTESAEVKGAVLEAYMIGDDVPSLLSIAMGDESVERRKQAVEYLGVADAVD